MQRLMIPARGGHLAGLNFGRAQGPIDLVFLHATGFNALTYRQLLQPLADRFRVVALDPGPATRCRRARRPHPLAPYAADGGGGAPVVAQARHAPPHRRPLDGRHHRAAGAGQRAPSWPGRC
jgi:hypothetical protein